MLLGCTLSGKLLPPQVIYQGKTNVCHPKFKFPDTWNVTHSENHWSNTTTMIEYCKNVLQPYIETVRDSLPITQLNQEALCIFDVFAAHRTDEFKSALTEANIKLRYVPASCTGELQPLDISGNNDFKKSLKSQFQSWYSKQVDKQIQSGVSLESVNVDLKLSTLKPVHAGWLVSATEAITSDSIMLGWDKSGIRDALSKLQMS